MCACVCVRVFTLKFFFSKTSAMETCFVSNEMRLAPEMLTLQVFVVKRNWGRGEGGEREGETGENLFLESQCEDLVPKIQLQVKETGPTASGPLELSLSSIRWVSYLTNRTFYSSPSPSSSSDLFLSSLPHSTEEGGRWVGKSHIGRACFEGVKVANTNAQSTAQSMQIDACVRCRSGKVKNPKEER
ncbi:hypothetical protein BGZ63DRAFT_194004 [Mariannaea sp. PMI_226]|nr:hypothetical protein BGZ63DRAFT_194004 [Mariannaea sp. PMI_226]